MVHDAQSAQISQRQEGRNTFVIMKTMCTPDDHHSCIVATPALAGIMYGQVTTVDDIL